MAKSERDFSPAKKKVFQFMSLIKACKNFIRTQAAFISFAQYFYDFIGRVAKNFSINEKYFREDGILEYNKFGCSFFKIHNAFGFVIKINDLQIRRC